MQSAHSAIETFFNCPGCGIKATNRGNMARHIREVHPESATRLMRTLMNMDPKETAEVPRELKRPFESTPKQKAEKPKIKKTKTLQSEEEPRRNNSAKKTKIDLTEQDKAILQEFLVLDEDLLKTESTKKPDKKATGGKIQTIDKSCQTEPMALTLEEILAYCDAVLYRKPDCPTMKAPKVTPDSITIAELMNQRQTQQSPAPESQDGQETSRDTNIAIDEPKPSTSHELCDLYLSSDSDTDEEDDIWKNI